MMNNLINKVLILASIVLALPFSGCVVYHQKTLVPDQPSAAMDYFCTWNVQGYVSSFASTPQQRNAMTEQNLFGNGRYENWTGMYEKIRGDLYFVLDDAWDIPLSGDQNYYGSLILDAGRFPSTRRMMPQKRLKWLSDSIKKRGWRGLGLWISAQEAPRYQITDTVSYWSERLAWMDKADIGYWKVDWGKHDADANWRMRLTRLGKQLAPGLHIEHALSPAAVAFAEVYRTYDVENIIAIPHTIDRIAALLTNPVGSRRTAVLNCEDEPYIAVGTGSAIGIMRHEFNGNLPDGVQDFVFPPQGRDLKSRLDEVVRAVRWHRIAAPFAIDQTQNVVDTVKLRDFWVMGEKETWVNRAVGSVNEKSAPAIIARGLEKPEVTLANGDILQPYILASKYPNGAVAVASIGRTIKRSYLTPRANVLVKMDRHDQPIGIFGRYNQLTFQFSSPKQIKTVLAQDLAGDEVVNITGTVRMQDDQLIIPGKVIDEIGLMSATKGDLSEPGMVLVIK
ncbi:hypothetical protein [Pedobacter sp. JY14-1]|uniref:hypothetical protein n=1 Tax=Pedobacter sp. JY14-1 TaxID=3034151 RepID=UPI0023E0DA89|nr:hypothetical protein [Pedobacter sp. JY14-1]